MTRNEDLYGSVAPEDGVGTYLSAASAQSQIYPPGIEIEHASTFLHPGGGAGAFAGLNNPGGFSTDADLLTQFAPNVGARISFQFASPKPRIFRGRVCAGEGIHALDLCSLDDPLLAQIIALRPFLVPENGSFWAEWVREIRGRMSDFYGRQIMFSDTPEDSITSWFDQLPQGVLDPKDPLSGVSQLMPLIVALQGKQE